MKTDHTTPVLMSPEQLPQQRLAVTTFPEKPATWLFGSGEQPKLLDAPKRSPRNVELICSADGHITTQVE